MLYFNFQFYLEVTCAQLIFCTLTLWEFRTRTVRAPLPPPLPCKQVVLKMNKCSGGNVTRAIIIHYFIPLK